MAFGMSPFPLRFGSRYGASGQAPAPAYNPLASWVTFNGTSSYIHGTGISNVGDNGNVTTAAWVRLRDGDNAEVQRIFSQGRSGWCFNYGMAAVSGNLQALNTNSSFNLAGGTFSDETWYHLAIVCDGTTATGYVNGIATGTTSTSGRTTNCTALEWAIGVTSELGTQLHWLAGDVAEVAVWLSALSPENVAAHYAGTMPGSPAAWWKFDEGTGTVLNDSVASFDGTIVNGSWGAA